MKQTDKNEEVGNFQMICLADVDFSPIVEPHVLLAVRFPFATDETPIHVSFFR